MSFPNFLQQNNSKTHLWDFLDGLVVKTHDSTAKGAGLILGPGTKILHPTWCRKKKREICVHVLRIHSWV